MRYINAKFIFFEKLIENKMQIEQRQKFKNKKSTKIGNRKVKIEYKNRLNLILNWDVIFGFFIPLIMDHYSKKF